MRILVIDDNPIHLESARIALTGHELVTIDNYDEALEVLKRTYDFKRFSADAKQGLTEPTSEERDADPETWTAYWNAYQAAKARLNKEDYRPKPFDVVLTDYLMPAGKHEQGGPGLAFVGQEMAVGWSLALLAILEGGAKYAAVVTATGHHSHPASAMLDALGESSWGWGPHPTKTKPYFTINGAAVGFYHAPFWHFGDTACSTCQGSKTSGSCQHCIKLDSPRPSCGSCNGTGQMPCFKCSGSGLATSGKDWAKVLEAVMQEK